MTRKQAEKIADRIWGADIEETVAALLAAAREATEEQRKRDAKIVRNELSEYPDMAGKAMNDYDDGFTSGFKAACEHIAAAIERDQPCI